MIGVQALVTGIIPGGVADRHDIRSGDVIHEFNGKAISRSQPLHDLLRLSPTGIGLEVKVWREDKSQSVMVVLPTLAERLAVKRKSMDLMARKKQEEQAKGRERQRRLAEAQRKEMAEAEAKTRERSKRQAEQRSLVMAVQRQLAELDYKPGDVDGVQGGKTQDAILVYQRLAGLSPTGKVSEELLGRLNDDVAAKRVAARTRKTPTAPKSRLGLPSPPAIDERGMKVKIMSSRARDAEVEAEVELYSRSYALVIGNDNYTNGWPRLGQAIGDASRIADALEARGFEVTLKTDLGSESLENTFEDFFIDKGSDADARLFVWFAGHGHTDQRGEGYLIPTDGALEKDRGRFLRTALSLRDFGKFVRLAESKHVFTVFDSCFAGTIFNVARAAPPPQITRITTRPVRQFLTSGDAGQLVSDDGTFAKLFIEALAGERQADGNNDGYLTASEIGSFLDTKMSNYSKNRQTPRYGTLNSPDFDKGDFVFMLPRAASSAGKRRPVAPGGATVDKEAMFWRSIEGSKQVSDYEAYLQQFPDGTFATLARNRIKDLKRN